MRVIVARYHNAGDVWMVLWHFVRCSSEMCRGRYIAVGKYVVDRTLELIDKRLLFNSKTFVLSTDTFTTHSKRHGGEVSTPSWYWEVQVSNYVDVVLLELAW